jgi:hypothetical protein
MFRSCIMKYFLYSEKNDVQCFSLPDLVVPLWGIICTYSLTVFFSEKLILWIHFGENVIDIWGGADFGLYSSVKQCFTNLITVLANDFGISL